MKTHLLVRLLCVMLLLLLTTTPATAGTIIHVPADQPTIEAGINAASNGDTVLVAPGTYQENINFLGKAITVKSSSGARVTIIDGGAAAPVVTFSSNETLTSTLSGFTLQNGNANVTSGIGEGGGVFINFASPTIMNNIIQNNVAATSGGGIGVYFGSPLIKGNTIKNNSQVSGYSGGEGGGIQIGGASTAQVIGNTIENNSWTTGWGGGIALFNSVSTLIQNNIITGNVAGVAGGGISMFNGESGTIVVQNVIIGNSAPGASGLYWSNPPAALINNTITDSPSASGAAMSTDDFGTPVTIANNLIVANQGATNALYCGGQDVPSQTFYNNDVVSANGAAYAGVCTDQTGFSGNISNSPKFVSKSNVRLKGGSPTIDAGSNSAPNLLAKDLAGNPRIINGNNLPSSIVDMGAYEFVPVVLSPKSLNFGTQAIGSTVNKTVTLANKQNKTLTISSYSVPTGYSVSGCSSSIAAFSSCILTVTFHPLSGGQFKGMLSVTDDAGNSPQTVGLFGSAQ